MQRSRSVYSITSIRLWFSNTDFTNGSPDAKAQHRRAMRCLKSIRHRTTVPKAYLAYDQGTEGKIDLLGLQKVLNLGPPAY